MNTLRRDADLEPTDRVLDIGSGSGRLGYGLTDYVAPGNYTGFDIDHEAIEACRASNRMRQAGFTFVAADLFNDMYSPGATQDAAQYRLPFADDSFEVTYLGSVFTHLLYDEVANYASEIRRILTPGGRCVFTAYLTDGPSLGLTPRYRFVHEVGGALVHDPEMPRLSVAYSSSQFNTAFGSEPVKVMYGEWREGPPGQDQLVYRF